MSVGASPGATAAAEEPEEEFGGRGLRLTSAPIRHLGRPFRIAMSVTSGLQLGITATRVAQAVLVARILGHVLAHRGAVAPELAGIALLGALRPGLVWMQGRQSAASAARVTQTLRGGLWASLARLGPGYLTTQRTGAVQSSMVEGVEALGDYYARFVPLAAASAVSVAGLLAWIAVLVPAAAAVMAGCAVLVPLAPVLTGRAFGQTGQRFAESLGRLAAEYLDAIQGLLTLKAFNAADRWGRRLADRCEEVAADATALGGLATMHVGFVSLGMAAGTTLGVAVAVVQATHHAVAPSALLAVLVLAWECFRPLGELQAGFPAAYRAVAGANAVLALLKAPTGVPEPAAPQPVDASALAASVAFEEVSFSYGPGRPEALAAVSFRAEPGETVAIVGSSGAGKTTLVWLLMRFFDPTAGIVRIGGVDLRLLTAHQRSGLIAASFQDTYLLHRSVADNLRLARPQATQSELEAAARAAQVHEVVAALPRSYDTVIGERGSRLSGGERQRLAIARALLADTPILVLDEPTSNVDAASEALITEALEAFTAGRTTIVIAHRLSTVRRADRVIVLERGRVVQSGTPAELQERGGAFARLVAAQEVAG